MRRSLRYERYARDVADFIDAYQSLYERARNTRRPNVGSALTWLTDPESVELIERTEVAAGRAQPAVEAAGVVQQRFGRVYRPLYDWRNSFESGPMTPSEVLSYSRALRGQLERRAEEAREAERGLVGLVGRFVRFPTDVREAAGLSSRVGQRSSFVIAIAAQVIATLLATGILALIGVLIGTHV